MDIKEQFNLIAGEYDKNRKKFIPYFNDFYHTTTEFIASNIDTPKQIIDLGAGTGLLTYFWYQFFPDSEYVLVDIADEMLNVAKQRFAGIENIVYRTEDYYRTLPAVAFDTVISALSIHHLENHDKASLFSKIYDKLPHGGLFVNYDQFCTGQPALDRRMNAFWENKLVANELTQQDIARWKERRKLDRECSVEKEIDMLRHCGFKIVQCVYSYLKFSVIIAIK